MSKKLEDSHTARKVYWTILNRLFVDGNFISDFCAKANIFNNYLASICTPIKNASVLPPFSCKTNPRMNSFKKSGFSYWILLLKVTYYQ